MDLRPLLRPRHLVLTLLVGVLAGGTIAAAGAAPDPDVPAILSSPVSLPARSVGDHGVYEVWDDHRIDGSDPASWGEPHQVIEFTWEPDELHYDDTGQLVWTNVLRLQVTRDDQEPNVQNTTILLRAGTNVPVGTLYESPVSFGEPGQGPLATESWTQEGFSRTIVLGRSSNWATDPCFVLPTQGKPLVLDARPIDGFEDCWWANSGYVEAVVRVQAVGGKVGERDVLLRSAIPGLMGSQTVGRVWLREGLPYGVRFERVGGEENTYAVALLTRFDAGTLPMRGKTAPVDSIPLLERAPRQVWGPSEAGIMHPFPLSAAFAASRDHATYDGLRTFLRDHPDAYVCWAQYAAFEDNTRSQQRWTFGVTDGAQVLGLETLRTQGKGPSISDPLAVVPGQASVQVTVEPVEDPTFSDFVPLSPADAPAQLPTVESLYRTWAGYAAKQGTLQGLEANAWSFRVGADPDGVWFSAGHIDHTSTSNVPTELGAVGPASSGWTMSTLSFVNDRPWSFGESRTTENYAPVGVPPAAAPVTPQDVEPADQQPTAVHSRDARFEWTPRQRAAIGLGALGAALLWWLSPLAKGGLSGLFSRIRDDELLEHPVRRLARDLVEANPGMHHQDLVRRLGKGKGGAEHHLRKLVEGGVLLRRAAHGYTCYFLPAQASRAAVTAAPLLKSPVAQRIVEIKRAEPLVTNAELARRLDVRPATIHYHVTRLRQAGLIVDLGATDDASVSQAQA